MGIARRGAVCLIEARDLEQQLFQLLIILILLHLTLLHSMRQDSPLQGIAFQSQSAAEIILGASQRNLLRQ